MPKKNNKFPNWFNPHHKPYFSERKPKQVKEPEVEKEEKYGNNDTFFLYDHNGRKVEVYANFDIEHGYYNDVSVSGHVHVQYKSDGGPNLNYEKELAEYKDKKAAHEQTVKKWHQMKKEWDKEQDAKNVERRRKQYLKLQQEFGGVVHSDQSNWPVPK